MWAPLHCPAASDCGVWAAEGDCDPGSLRSNTFEMQWPPQLGPQCQFSGSGSRCVVRSRGRTSENHQGPAPGARALLSHHGRRVTPRREIARTPNALLSVFEEMCVSRAHLSEARRAPSTQFRKLGHVQASEFARGGESVCGIVGSGRQSGVFPGLELCSFPIHTPNPGIHAGYSLSVGKLRVLSPDFKVLRCASGAQRRILSSLFNFGV